MLVELKNVNKSFRLGDGSVSAVNGVDLKIKKGEFIVLKGASGSGKSTLLNLLSAVESISSGEIYICGQPLMGLSERERSKLRLNNIGIVFQSFNLIPVLTALENVVYPLTLKGETATSAKQKAERALIEVGLEKRMHQRPVHLSGGQMQRVAIARAIVTRPSLVLADEPTANLDSATATNIMELMQSLNKEHNITFIIATHDDYVMGIANRIITLKDGYIHEDVQLATKAQNQSAKMESI